jgi:tetratricopeptide (TPR) repeat protein
MVAPALVLALVGAANAAVPPASETAAAREQARLCEITTGESSLAACRRAIEMGLGPARLWPVRQIVARRLAALEMWEELAEHFRGDVALRPGDTEAYLKLGSVLLFGLGRLSEAEAALSESIRLAPDVALGHALLALALGASGRSSEAAAEFDIARHLDDHIFDHRPAMAAAYEAAQGGEPWP